MDKPFQKDLSHLSWTQVYERQAQRAGLVNDWMDGLHLKLGDRVLEIGAGPGYVSLALAEPVGSYGRRLRAGPFPGCSRISRTFTGRSRHSPNSAHRRRRGRAGADQRQGRLGTGHDGAAPRRRPAKFHNVTRCLPDGAPVVIGEFHPEGPCSSGPPREHRLSPAQVERWCEQAGLTMVGYRQQTVEHYMFAAQSGAPPKS